MKCDASVSLQGLIEICKKSDISIKRLKTFKEPDPDPSCPDPGRRKETNLTFYFHISFVVLQKVL